MHKKSNNKKGFTLVEMVTVIVIIAIIAAIAIPSYKAVTSNANSNACSTNVKILQGAWDLYSSKNPDTSIPIDFIKALVDSSYIRDELKCESGGNYKLNNGVVYCDKHGPFTTAGVATQTPVIAPSNSPTNSPVVEPSPTPSPSMNCDVNFMVNDSDIYGGVGESFNYKIKITNRSLNYIYGWAYEFNYPGVLKETGDLKLIGDHRYKMNCSSNTYSLAPGASCETPTSSGTNYQFKIISNVIIRKTYDEVNCRLDMKITYKKQDAYVNFGLYNNSSKPIIGWVLEFDYDGVITTTYDNILSKVGANRYQIVSNNGKIEIPANGGSINFDGAVSTVGNNVSNVTLDGKPISNVIYTH